MSKPTMQFRKRSFEMHWDVPKAEARESKALSADGRSSGARAEIRKRESCGSKQRALHLIFCEDLEKRNEQ